MIKWRLFTWFVDLWYLHPLRFELTLLCLCECVFADLWCVSAIKVHWIVNRYPSVEPRNNLLAFIHFELFLLDSQEIGFGKVSKIAILNQISKIHIHFGTRYVFVQIFWYPMVVFDQLATTIAESQTPRHDSFFLCSRLTAVIILWLNRGS